MYSLINNQVQVRLRCRLKMWEYMRNMYENIETITFCVVGRPIIQLAYNESLADNAEWTVLLETITYKNHLIKREGERKENFKITCHCVIQSVYFCSHNNTHKINTNNSSNLGNAAIRLRFPSCKYFSRDFNRANYTYIRANRSYIYLSMSIKTPTDHSEQIKNCNYLD